MALKVEFNHPEFPKGEEFDLGGILVPNGGSVELNDDEETAYAVRHGKTVKDRLAGNEYAKVSGTATVSKKEAEGGEG